MPADRHEESMRPAFGPCKAHGPAGVRPATSARIAILQVGLTGGVRPVRARRQWSRSHPFPFPLPALIIGEEKAKCQTFLPSSPTCVPPRLLRQQNPRDLFRTAPTRDSLVVVGIALTHRKRHQWVARQPPAVNLLLTSNPRIQNGGG